MNARKLLLLLPGVGLVLFAGCFSNVSAEYYFQRGLAHYETCDLEQAIADYTNALELDPNLADAYFNRGGANYHSGNLEQALRDYEQYLELAPNAPDRVSVRIGIKDIKSEFGQ